MDGHWDSDSQSPDDGVKAFLLHHSGAQKVIFLHPSPEKEGTKGRGKIQEAKEKLKSINRRNERKERSIFFCTEAVLIRKHFHNARRFNTLHKKKGQHTASAFVCHV